MEEVRNNSYVLMPGRYVATEEEADDGIPFDDEMKALTAKLASSLPRVTNWKRPIRENLKGIWYEF